MAAAAAAAADSRDAPSLPPLRSVYSAAGAALSADADDDDDGFGSDVDEASSLLVAEFVRSISRSSRRINDNNNNNNSSSRSTRRPHPRLDEDAYSSEGEEHRKDRIGAKSWSSDHDASDRWIAEDLTTADDGEIPLVESPTKFIAIDAPLSPVLSEQSRATMQPQRRQNDQRRPPSALDNLPRIDDRSLSPAELEFIASSKKRARGVTRSPPPSSPLNTSIPSSRSSPISFQRSDNTSTRSLFARSSNPSPEPRIEARGHPSPARSDRSRSGRSSRARSHSPAKSTRSSLMPLTGSPTQSIQTDFVLEQQRSAAHPPPSSADHSPVGSVTPVPSFYNQNTEFDAAEFRVHSLATPPPQPVTSSSQNKEKPGKDRSSIMSVTPKNSANRRKTSVPDLRGGTITPKQRSSSPSLNSARELAEQLSVALDDVDRLQRDVSRLRDDVGRRDDEIFRLQDEVRRAEDWVARINDEAIRHIRQVEVRMQGSIDDLKNQLYDAVDHARALEQEAANRDSTRDDASDGREKAQVMEIRRLEGIVQQLNSERQELKDLLDQEKAKSGRTEDEFRLFSRRLRSLQDSNRELRNENETLRSELRKYQYEGSTSNTAVSDTFYKDKLEQALYDIDSLKSIATTLSEQNDSLRAALDARQAGFSPTKTARRVPPAINIRSPPRAGTPVRRGAWEASPVSETDRTAFAERMRRLEDQDADGTTRSPSRLSWSTSSASAMATSSAARAVPPPPPDLLFSPPPGRAGRNVSNGVTNAMFGDGVDYIALRDSLESQLRALNAEKMALTAELQRVPMAGSGVRRRKDEIDDRLDEVEKGIGAIKQRMRGLHMF